jgi:hypothetical protein
MMEIADGRGEIIDGVVHPRGAAGVKLGGDDVWSLGFAFETWRDDTGAVHREELAMHRDGSHAELGACMERIRGLEVLRARVRFGGERGAELVELVEHAFDEGDALVQRAAELREPKTREHARFGTLTFVHRLGWWDATPTWCGVPVRLHLDGAADDLLEEALRAAEELFDDQPTWSRRVRDFAVEKLLPLKNKAWLDDDEEPLTPADFEARMTLKSITVSPEGDFDFFHDDGDLFWGHAIQVMGTLRDGPQDADIPG